MKKLLVGLHAFLFIFIISSCNNQKNPPENKVVNTVKSSDTTQVNGNQVGAEITGRGIIENASNRLNDKLNLSEQQFKKLNDILTKTFVEYGGDLNGKYPIENSNKMGRELRQKSLTSILDILDADQKERFERFMKK